MKIIFLGTSGSMPTPERSNSCVAVKRGRELILFDCGEGTQRQLVRARLSIQKISLILLTHMHGDHVLGVPGLLQSMTLLQREAPLKIIGPRGVHAYLQGVCSSLGGPGFPVEIHEVVSAGTVHEAPSFTVEVVQSHHRIQSWSYALVEKPRKGRFHPEKARNLGIPQGAEWKKLQNGEPITANGALIQPQEVQDPPRPGRRIVYSGDTTPTPEVRKLAKEADLLIHEATFLDELADRAAEDGHTTVKQAATLAREAGVKQLVLTHLSSRYTDPEPLLAEAIQVFPVTRLAYDLMELEIPLPD